MKDVIVQDLLEEYDIGYSGKIQVYGKGVKWKRMWPKQVSGAVQIAEIDFSDKEIQSIIADYS